MSFVLVDRILALTPGKSIIGIKHITAYDLYWQKGQFGQDVYSMPLIGETLGQLAALNAMHTMNYSHRPVAGIASGVHVMGEANIGDTLLLSATITKCDAEQIAYSGEVSIAGNTILKLDNALGPMLPMTELCSPQLAKQQFDSAYRPGEWVPTSANVEKQEQLPIKAIPVEAQYVNIYQDSKTAESQLMVSRSAPFFPDHFPNKPVLPMTLLLKAQLELGTELLKTLFPNSAINVTSIDKVKMREFIQPGDVVNSHAKVVSESDAQCTLEFQTRVDGAKLCVARVSYSKSES